MLGRRAVTLVTVLAGIGLAFGLGSLVVSAQDHGSCPANNAACDHAYLINGNYVWMRPLSTGLGIASLAFLASAFVLVLSVKLASRVLHDSAG